MGSEPFLDSDIGFFLEMAQAEGWICEPWELEFLLQKYPQGCRVWRMAGAARGFATSIRYGKSGWIGNLLVHPELRRRGIGRTLLEYTILSLLRDGAGTIWLTASDSGAELYRRLGFTHIDSVERWVGEGLRSTASTAAPMELEWLRAIDREGWGDRRDDLLQLACTRGALHSTSGGFLCRQQWADGLQIGPWGCLISSQAEALFDAALAAGEGRVFLDVPSGNHRAAALLRERGFSIKGRTALMYLGAPPSYRPEHIYALGSMGSMG